MKSRVSRGRRGREISYEMHTLISKEEVILAYLYEHQGNSTEQWILMAGLDSMYNPSQRHYFKQDESEFPKIH